MRREIKIYNLNGIYKVVSLPLVNDCKKVSNLINRNDDTKKLKNNLIRAKSKIRDLALCNDFKYFVTITFKPKFNNLSLSELRSRITRVIRRARTLYGRNLKLDYILIPEQHKSGMWHFHGLLGSDFDHFVYLNNFDYKSCYIFDNYGFNSVSTIIDKNKVSSYITKYITKHFAERHKGEHLYFNSQGLKKPVLVEDFIYSNDYFDNEFFDFVNEFCLLTYTSDIGACKLLKNKRSIKKNL